MLNIFHIDHLEKVANGIFNHYERGEEFHEITMLKTLSFVEVDRGRLLAIALIAYSILAEHTGCQDWTGKRSHKKA